ncbi:probable BOI-related E3 ubiquitin-protein ligase 2 [Salvia hispanica]|uniref:probable BOI-related E3 ubiquitin-protein ligase 2 n=1 Tax=Salvia hispanica TaxID=49212 RepID=UPI0020094263|nr:probable BOI-related E3 ubiquitin-protein ligase 2 [Salvia hispanica]
MFPAAKFSGFPSRKWPWIRSSVFRAAAIDPVRSVSELHNRSISPIHDDREEEVPIRSVPQFTEREIESGCARAGEASDGDSDEEMRTAAAAERRSDREGGGAPHLHGENRDRESDVAEENEAMIASLRENGAGDAEWCCRSVELMEEEKEKAVCRCCNSRNSCVVMLPCRHLCSCLRFFSIRALFVVW